MPDASPIEPLTAGLAAGRYIGARADGAVTWSDVEHYVCRRPAELSL